MSGNRTTGTGDKEKTIKIIIAAHKKYRMPDDPMYLPLHVGAKGKESIGYQRDDEGDNISELNPLFSELTGLYWGWKHIDADYIGLVHYRRYFEIKHSGADAWKRVMTGEDIKPFLGRIKVFTPTKRKYYIETLYSHYIHTHYAWQMDITRRIIADRCPEYLQDFDTVMKQPWGYMFNMLIIDREWLNDYCTWVFDILFELRNRTGDRESRLTPFQKRYYGRVSEIIFNVWLHHRLAGGELKEDELMTIPVRYMERIDIVKKATAFMRAKVLGERYKNSF